MSKNYAQEEIYNMIKEFVFQVVSTSNGEITIGDIGDDLTDLGLNSVDYLEFIIKLENTFDVDIPDELLVENENTTIQSWAELIYSEINNG
jgi:acyl carrier protein